MDRAICSAGLRQRLAPEGVGVGVLAADAVGRLGGAAEVQRIRGCWSGLTPA